MIHYTFNTHLPAQQYIQISMTFSSENSTEIVHIPSWRPGRYELGNFAKNVKSFTVFNEKNERVLFQKLNKDTWELHTENASEIRIEYQYFANELNAGSTFLSKDQLYVNPVNCCLFVAGKENQPHHVKLNIPTHFELACSIKHVGNEIFATSFDELADAPFIASSQLQHDVYQVKGIDFHLWFNGEIKVDWKRIKKDFTAFTAKQLEKYTEFPVPAYHFFFQIVPYRAYHGVEHLTSTVILLGPSYDIFGSFYKELLGVSSHELYHTWNVKAIRPAEMFPYNFKTENYSKLGYVCEGVTTYMGDLFLFKSGVFSLEQYFLELNNQLQKHFDNFGRFNYSVAESSFDTWLDGYVPGAPNRKVSIYTEGCLLAFVTDVFIIKHSKERHRLDDVMKKLYYDCMLNKTGYTELDYQRCVEQYAGTSFQSILDDYFYGTKSFEAILMDAFDYLGFELIVTPSPKYSFGRLGFKWQQVGTHPVVKAISPGSPAELGGLMLEDEILAVNTFSCSTDLDQWLRYFDEDVKTVSVLRKGQLIEVTFPEVNRNFYSEYAIREVEERDPSQQRGFACWMK
jgi:predicted metalloprotease with PDZ domain